jgi:hypothetical protein
MSLIMTIAASLAMTVPGAGPTPYTAPPPAAPTNGSEDEMELLFRLNDEIRTARAAGSIDGATAKQFELDSARLRRQIFRLGLQIGYRQHIRMRARINAVRARLAERIAAGGR